MGRMTPRRLVVLLAAVNGTLFLLGAVVAPATGPGPGAAYKVGLVFDVGGKNDKSFNEGAWRGLELARHELGVRVTSVEPSEGADRESALRNLAASGNDLVIGVGYIFSRDIDRLAARFPDVKFACVDYAPPTGAPIPANVAGLAFREHEGSFVVGAIAGLVSRTKTVGFVGGMQGPLIRKFEVGFGAGVRHVCPRCRVLAAYAGTTPAAYADPTKGQELASAQLDQGADVIYHASGKTGDGVFAAVRQRKKLAIGVDSDQHSVAPCCIVTSMLKRVDIAVRDAIRDGVNGTFQGGRLIEHGLAERGLDFVANEENRHLLPPEVAARARQLAIEIVDGAIRVPSR